MLDEIFEAFESNPKAINIIREALMQVACEHGPDCDPGLMVISTIVNIKLARRRGTQQHQELVDTVILPTMEAVYKKHRPNY